MLGKTFAGEGKFHGVLPSVKPCSGYNYYEGMQQEAILNTYAI